MTKTSKSIWDKLLEFINYWWFRYLMVTELYIVEKWERVVIHVFFLAVFLLQWCFNQTILLKITGTLLGLDNTQLRPTLTDSHNASS
uniref:CSON000319 protein n=1 Tax=Culicoides sonorensis TaxID=179676 RepID=A0A336MFE7_CULSO